MNEESLPEELIYDILRSCIVASPETFLDPANSRAFFRRPDAPPSPIGSSHLLLVSKRWRRIGTPLLYTSLWLSKAFHTLTVADLFQSYPSLAERVIDLRLEGGFVPQILDLIRLAPNIRNVYLSWHLDKLDDTTSLHKALRCLQPKTLYLGHQREDVGLRQQSAALSTLVDSLVSEGWQSLVRRVARLQSCNKLICCSRNMCISHTAISSLPAPHALSKRLPPWRMSVSTQKIWRPGHGARIS